MTVAGLDTCGLCGGPLVRNPHPNAGSLTENVGYVWACVPCMAKAMAGWSKRALTAEGRIAAVRSIVDYWDAMPGGDGNLLFRSAAVERLRHALDESPADPRSANDYDECNCPHAEDQHNVWTGEPWVFQCNFGGCNCRLKIEARV